MYQVRCLDYCNYIPPNRKFADYDSLDYDISYQRMTTYIGIHSNMTNTYTVLR